MRGHLLKNELISLSPTHFETIQDFFTKLKSLVLQLKQCGIEKKQKHLILSILLNLGPEYSVSVSTFHSTKLTTQIWRIPSLEEFMESFTQEKDKLVQIGIIKSSKYQSLSIGVSNPAKGKKKSIDSKQEKPKSSDGGLNPTKEKDKKKEENTKCTYFHKGGI